MSDQLFTEGLITLYQLDTTRQGGPVFHFTSATDFDHEIYWGGQLYSPVPMTAAGFEMTTKGAPPQPGVTISNLYGAGNLLLDSYLGLIGSDFIRILTLRRFLDDGATPDPTAMISREKFVVAQKTAHNAKEIAFKLATRMDQEGTKLPRRQYLRDICNHTYRFWNTTTQSLDYSKATCPYTRSSAWDANNNVTDWPHDACSRTMIGCTLRFGQWGEPLPARFFPGVGKVK
jgi:lambda family phage minor tail protein L